MIFFLINRKKFGRLPASRPKTPVGQLYDHVISQQAFVVRLYHGDAGSAPACTSVMAQPTISADSDALCCACKLQESTSNYCFPVGVMPFGIGSALICSHYTCARG
jgi:hypothetical protein